MRNRVATRVSKVFLSAVKLVKSITNFNSESSAHSVPRLTSWPQCANVTRDCFRQFCTLKIVSARDSSNELSDER
jgi:hypothetical protein